MAVDCMWFKTELPDEMIDLIKDECNFRLKTEGKNSELLGGITDTTIRNSVNAWLPTTNWIAGYLWYYISRANRDNFLYDLEYIDGEQIQVTSYGVNEYYGWHVDGGLGVQYSPHGHKNERMKHADDFINENIERVRKLSFSLQLSDHDDYKGGQLQIMDDTGQVFFAPKKKGTLIIFDSRVKHRVRKVTEGNRLSLVGWVMGPRWR